MMLMMMMMMAMMLAIRSDACTLTCHVGKRAVLHRTLGDKMLPFHRMDGGIYARSDRINDTVTILYVYHYICFYLVQVCDSHRL
jgi:hypothetical protein